MSYPVDILEESLKQKVAQDFFPQYDCSNILGRVDFSACIKDTTPTLFDNDFMLWGEAKRGVVKDIYTSFVQLILTIGKEKTFDKYLPPVFLCEFDCVQIAFLPYHKIIDYFYQNDFNWNVAPSDHTTKEFSQLYNIVKSTLDSNVFVYSYDKDEKILREFIKKSFITGKTEFSKTRITKNNFISIFNRWQDEVRSTIAVNWDVLYKNGIFDHDFFLADAMSSNNMTISQKLQVLLRDNHYILDRKKNKLGLFTSSEAHFTDEGIAHARFWLKYERPPKKEYQEYIIFRKDLLKPQDVREYTGSYFTPKVWVELAQKYIEDELGENWQDEFYVWDCCAGTGNLLAGLRNKYNLYASTLDKPDVDVMNERIVQGANLLPDHVFQFDFLNDGYADSNGNIISLLKNCEKLPPSLRDILNDDEKRSKLIVFINPPCAESANKSLTKGKKDGVAVNTQAYKIYQKSIGLAARDLYAQFLFRIYKEINPGYIAEFSKLKHIQSPAFKDFRRVFRADFKRGFVVPCDTFDNVKGKFPYGFMIWRTGTTVPEIENILLDVYNRNATFEYCKTFNSYKGLKSINDWIITTRKRASATAVGYITSRRHDIQGIRYVYLINGKEYVKSARGTVVTDKNLREIAVYFAAQLSPEFTWINDLDQFTFPNDYVQDEEFITDCFTFMLFHGQNRITKELGANTWIPFSEDEVGSRERFSSHFMFDYIHGKNSSKAGTLPGMETGASAMSFSKIATDVFDAGREVFRYYHQQQDVDVNASLYDIRAYFQGYKVNKNGKQVMNPDSDDAEYKRLIGNLRKALNSLAKKIEPKIYYYGFLR